MRRVACESVGVLRVASTWFVASRPAGGNAHAVCAGCGRCSGNIAVATGYGETITEDLILAALHMTIRDRQPPALIYHTDRSGQAAAEIPARKVYQLREKLAWRNRAPQPHLVDMAVHMGRLLKFNEPESIA